MSKHSLFLLLFFLTTISLQGQNNYIVFDQVYTQYKLIQKTTEKINRFEGKYFGGALHFSGDNLNSFNIGLGLNEISYQKEWKGNFPETNQFGIAEVNGKISYWTFPLTYAWTGIKGPRSYYRCGGYRRERYHFGFSISYVPSFLAKTTYTAETFGGADLNTFLSTFQSNEQNFQHSLTFALSEQFLLMDKHLLLGVETYAGLGSGYFKESGSHLTTVSYGLRIKIGIQLKIPHIEIQKEVEKGNAEEKKKLLEQKQKEIEEKLKKKPTQ